MIDMPLSDASRRIRRVFLGDMLPRTALKFGDRTAVVDGGQRINYTELDRRSSQFAHWLLVDIPAGLRALAAGACGEGVVARGKAHLVAGKGGFAEIAIIFNQLGVMV